MEKKEKYYSVWESSSAIKLIESNPIAAKEIFQEYLCKYPNDYYTYTYYIMLLITLCEFEEAEKVYKEVNNAYQNDAGFLKSASRLNGFTFNMLICKAKLLAYQEKYQELYYLYLNNMERLEPNQSNYISYTCKAKLNLLNNESQSTVPLSYRFMQVSNYSEELFFDHIKSHLQAYNKDMPNQSPVVFTEDFPIKEVLKEIKKYIPSDKKLCTGLFENIYYFKFNNCGRVNTKMVNTFAVICFHNTNQFITMYPVIDNDNLPFVDLNYLVENKEKDKVKTISQIDKFKKRYHYN